MIEGEAALPPGRALDLGCGTGTNVVYLTKHGWEATGVDFSAAAIQQAQRKISRIASAHFIEGDVTKLRESGIQGPFDLVLDMGCYHALPACSRQAYVQEISAVMRPGAVLLMWEVSEKNKGIPSLVRIPVSEITDRFGKDFSVERVEARDFVVARMKRRFHLKANWYELRRKE